jgi:SpoVK/Ycf46/Vps4 family AAA+-type ATPase
MHRRLVFEGMVVPVFAGARPHSLEVLRCVVSELQVSSGARGATDTGECPCGVILDATEILCWAEEATTPLQPVKQVEETSQTTPSSGTSREGVPPLLLIIGELGTGKSFRINQLLERHTLTGRYVKHLQLHRLAHSDSSVTAATYLRRTFAECCDIAQDRPVTLVLDDLHMVAGTAAAASVLSSPWATLHLETVLRECLDDVASSRLPVSVVASAVPDKLSERILNRFAAVEHLTAPSTGEERLAVLTRCLTNNSIALDGSVDAAGLRSVCERAHGFIPHDLNAVSVTAAMIAFSSQRTAVGMDDLRAAARQTRPSVLKGFEVSTAQVKWSDIGGSDQAKAVLQDCVAWCLGRNKELFEKYRLSPPKGVLLYGPPGCSKTMLAKALATESAMNFISVKGPEVFSKWVGDSEKAVRDIFVKARLVMPCVIFIDELDGMCGHRGAGGVADRVISQFLTELDGMPDALAKAKSSIVIVAATNRPDNIDPAVLRPGRIDRKVYVGLPELAERVAIAAIGLRKMPLGVNVSAEGIAARTVGYSGAEIVALCKEAALQAINESTEAERIEERHVDVAVRKVTPRITPADIAWYLSWRGGRQSSMTPFPAHIASSHPPAVKA